LTIRMLFQSVSGLWDRRNPATPTPWPRPARFNPSPVCGTGEIPDQRHVRRGAQVSIRLRSVGPEKSPRHRADVKAILVSIRLRSVGPEKCGTWYTRHSSSCFNPSPVCGTGEILALGDAALIMVFQSVSGLWDRRNEARVLLIVEFSEFQSVSGLWDRRNHPAGRRPTGRSGFNPSPVCGTGEIPAAATARRSRSVSIRLRSVGPEKSAPAQVSPRLGGFQSVSGLWDRRNAAADAARFGRRGFNPSPVCGTGEIAGDRRREPERRVSIRLRSVGPEKSFTDLIGFNPSPVCGTGEIVLLPPKPRRMEFQSVSGLWDRRNRRCRLPG